MSTAPDRWSPCTSSPGAPVAEGGARARPPRPHGRSACRARRGTRAAPRSRVRSSTGRVKVMTPHGPCDALRLPSRRPGRTPRRTGPRKTSQCVVHRLRRAGGQSAAPSATRGRLHCSVVARAASQVLVRSAHPPRRRLSWCSIPTNRGPRTRSRRRRARPPNVVAVGAHSVGCATRHEKHHVPAPTSYVPVALVCFILSRVKTRVSEKTSINFNGKNATRC
jgi:hypothetical protein